MITIFLRFLPIFGESGIFLKKNKVMSKLKKCSSMGKKRQLSAIFLRKYILKIITSVPVRDTAEANLNLTNESFHGGAEPG
jgi:hypothetical protein